MMMFREAVKALNNPERFSWTLQGFGMFRAYLDDEKQYRLHIWNPEYRAEDVSDIHTHPWDFVSYVLAGSVRNKVYKETDRLHPFSFPTMRQQIKCGEGGGLVEKPETVFLAHDYVQFFAAGENYRMDATDIHASDMEDGTITLVKREFLDDTEHAYVYYDPVSGWVSAEPKPAHVRDVKYAIENSISKWGYVQCP